MSVEQPSPLLELSLGDLSLSAGNVLDALGEIQSDAHPPAIQSLARDLPDQALSTLVVQPQTDLVNSLEAEITQLRAQLATSEAMMREKMTAKNAQLDLMRMRSSRLEFAQKEAIHFLSKPLEKCSMPEFQVQVATKFAMELVECLRFALKYLHNASAAVSELKLNAAQTGVDRPALSVVPSLIALPLQSNASPHSSTDDSTPLGLLKQQRQENSHSRTMSGKSISDLGGQISTRKLPEQYSASLLGGTDIIGNLGKYPVMTEKKPSGFIMAETAKSVSLGVNVSSVLHSLPRSSNSPKSHSPVENNVEDGEEDLTSTSRSLPMSKLAPSCANCRAFSLQTDHYGDKIIRMNDEFTHVQEQMDQERQLHERVQTAKDILETEIEELTAQLFDQANKMVVEEAKLRDELEVANRGLKGRLEDTIKKLTVREAEFTEMKKTLSMLDDAKRRSSFTGHSSNNHVHSGSPLSPPRNHSGSNVSLSGAIFVDGIALTEFQDFLRIVTSTKESKDSMLQLFGSEGSDKINNTPFVKRCQIDDVEPCLFNNLSSNWIKSNMGMRRRLLEAVVHGTCDIRPYTAFGPPKSKSGSPILKALSPSSTATTAAVVNIDSSSTALSYSDADQVHQLNQSHSSQQHLKSGIIFTAAPLKKCFACGIRRECEYGMKFPSTPLPTLPLFSGDEVNPLDRFCRDKIVAVMDFYMWVGRLRHEGVGTKPLLDMFRACLWHRRRMNEARVGSMGLFPSSSRDKDAMDESTVLVQANVTIVH